MKTFFYGNKSSSVFVSSVDSNSNSVVWHAGLGHIGQGRITRMVKEGLLGLLTQVRQLRCEPCLASRAIKKPFGKASRALSSLELFHSNICGLLNVVAHNGAIYILTLIDDFQRYGYVYLLSHRHKTLDVFKCFVAEVKTILERRVKTFRTHCGREYLSDVLKGYCEEKV